MLDTQVYKHTLRICNSGCTNAPKCFVIVHGLSFFFFFIKMAITLIRNLNVVEEIDDELNMIRDLHAEY